MQLNPKSLLSLKAPILVFLLLFWNAGFGYAMFLHGDFPEGFFTNEAGKIVGTVCLTVCSFFLLVAFFPSFQDIVVSEKRKMNFSNKEFYFISFITLILGLSRLIINFE